MGTRTIKLGESFRVEYASLSSSHAKFRSVIEEPLVQHSCPSISTKYTSQSHAWHVNHLNREIERSVLMIQEMLCSYICLRNLILSLSGPFGTLWAG